MARLHNMGEKLELDSIEAAFQGKSPTYRHCAYIWKKCRKSAPPLAHMPEDPAPTTKSAAYTDLICRHQQFRLRIIQSRKRC
ncbi:hypothetical protein Leryth_025434 [Lithospermum erythrorhizon]|nr:hypothetical protein Leryth_025434 [Lithospermum erythrorhizon]